MKNVCILCCAEQEMTVAQAFMTGWQLAHSAAYQGEDSGALTKVVCDRHLSLLLELNNTARKIAAESLDRFIRANS